jgi:hypothetical protein
MNISFTLLMCIFSYQQEETCRQTVSLKLLNNFIVMSSNLEYHFRHYKLSYSSLKLLHQFFSSFLSFLPLRLFSPTKLPCLAVGCGCEFLEGEEDKRAKIKNKIIMVLT